MALGQDITGARPGGGTMQLSGTSFAAPIVSGVAALLLSLQCQRGDDPDPYAVRAAILHSAFPCEPGETANGRRCLAGRLNIPGAYTLLMGDSLVAEPVDTAASASPSDPVVRTPQPDPPAPAKDNAPPPPEDRAAVIRLPAAAVLPSQAEHEGGLVYAVGTLGYDFGSEARRDSFQQLMPAVQVGDITVPANPYDARQMVDYLEGNLSEAYSLTWTLNLELTPIYAIEPIGAFGRDIYAVLHELLAGQIQANNSAAYIERVSLPGRLAGRTVQLFSGQVTPVVEVDNTRGLYGWRVNTLVSAALNAIQEEPQETDVEAVRQSLYNFLNRIYYDYRNLGTTSSHRALNFAATNAFQAASTFATAVRRGMELDSIEVERSAIARLDSDCWDVKLKFFDPENTRRARRVFRFIIDVSDRIPVSFGEVRSWSVPN